MKSIVSILTVFSLFVLSFGCDKVKQPIPEGEQISIDTSGGISWDTSYSEENLNTRNIVIEEFTGHTCKECPEGAQEIKRLQQVYGNQVIAVSIHAGTFAEPQDNPDGSFSTDFRTEAGNDYNSTFSVFYYPAAMVSRIENGSGSGNYIYSKGDWETVIQSVQNDAPLASIDITSIYSDSLNTGKVTVDTKWLKDGNANYKLQVHLLEDNITAWQISGSQHIEDYLHRHVLRKALNGSWGTDIPSSSTGDTNSQEFEYTVDEDWKEKDLILVAFVYDNATLEIIQGAEVHVLNH